MGLLNRSELDGLTLPERLTLISQLWESVENEQLPLPAAQQDELDRRLATLSADLNAATDWAVLKSELEARCP